MYWYFLVTFDTKYVAMLKGKKIKGKHVKALVNGGKKKEVKKLTPKVAWKDSIKNPENDAYVVEVAFNEGVDKSQVTQEQFNKRYRKSKY